MTCNHRTVIAAAALVILIYASRLFSQQPGRPPALERKIPAFDVRNVPMLTAVQELRSLGISVSFEEVELDPLRDRIFDKDKNPVGVRKLNFSIHVENITVNDILGAVVRADGEYTWSVDNETGMINIFPGLPKQESLDGASVLRWTIDSLDIENKGRIDSIQENLDLRAHGIALFWRGPYGSYNGSVSLHRKKISIVQALDKISSLEPAMCWTLAGFKGGRILTLVPCTQD